jgi:hypothetical protein
VDGNSFQEKEEVIYKTFQDIGTVNRHTSVQLTKEKV